jgi:hypothetical protein
MTDVDSKKGRCTSTFGIHKGDMQEQQKTDVGDGRGMWERVID